MQTTNKSKYSFSEAQKYIPGGVNSPVRAFGAVGGIPRFLRKAKGPYLYDIDGNEYVDTICSWGPAIVGHSHPEVVEAINKATLNGLSFGAPTQGETELAKSICSFIPSIEMLRLTSSGTEATMSAIRLARGVTKRTKIVKFEGCYHGHVDSLMVKSGSGLVTFGIASSPGIPDDTVAMTLLAPLDDEEAIEYLFKEHGKDIAAVVIEPLPANNGILLQRDQFLRKLRELCDENNSLLIFDEVISGFRFKDGSYGDMCGVTPDITALGKIIGGGLPVGAYGARSEIMEKLSPLGPVYQAGTLSGNPLAMAAGIMTLDLLDDEAYDYLEQLGQILEQRVIPVLEKHGKPVNFVRMGSLFWFSPGSGNPPTRADQIPSDAGKMYAEIHSGLLEKGYMLAPSAYEVGFISTSHTSQHIVGMVEALDEVLSEMVELR